MFRSVSACVPNSVITTEFTSLVNQEFNIWSNVTISVNGIEVHVRPIYLNSGDEVAATVTTPSSYLGYQFYPYTLDKKPQTFAVVNKNNYNATIKPVDARKRWYNYLPKSFEISWYNQQNSIVTVGTARNLVKINEVHVVLDAANKSVVFYSKDQYLVTRTYLPAAPIDYKKIPSTSVNYAQDLLVLCSNGRLYRVSYDSRAGGSEEFTPAISSSFALDDLPFQEDIPGVGSFLDYARSKLLAELFPVVTSFDIRNNIIWLAGGNKVYTLTLNFSPLTTITIPSGEVILNLACVGISAVVVTRSQKLFYVRATGAVTEAYSAAALGAPCTLPTGFQVVVPEGNAQKLQIFEEMSGTLALVNYLDTPDFIPAYCEMFDDRLWVTGHDSTIALRFSGSSSMQVFEFSEKVTLVSVIGNSILANHYLKDFVTLNLTGIQKVMPVKFESRTGPITQIGTTPVLMRMLGQQGLVPIPGPGISYYVNGQLGDGSIGCNSGDYLGISYRAVSAGDIRSTVILGDTAYDYDVKVISVAKLTDYFTSTVTALNRLSAGFGSFPGLDSGTADIGYTGPINLGFSLNVFGNVYSQIYVTTNGYIGFTNSALGNNSPIFGSLGVDAVYAEPKDLYQGLPVNNVDPTNITTGFLQNYQTPGLYYQERQLGEYKSYRIRWVGTTMSSYPLGNTVTTVAVSTSNWARIPVPSLDDFQANDYVSGGNITVSTRVLSKSSFSQNAQMYFSDATDEFILITNPITLPKYTSVLLSGTVLGFVSNTNYQTLSANTILSTVGNIITVDGITDPAVTTEWTFVRSNSVSRAQSISVISGNIIPITAINSNYINVSVTDYNKPVLGQILSGNSIIVPTRVTGFSTEYQVYRLYVDNPLVVEGSNVTFSLSSLNVPLTNGASIYYNMAAVSANVTTEDFGIPMAGFVTVANNYANVQVPITSDIYADTDEIFTFTITPEFGVSLSANVIMYDPTSLTVTPNVFYANSVSSLAYFVIANATINQTTVDPIYFDRTEIDFGKTPPIGPAALSYQYNRVNLINGTVLNSSIFYDIKFTGNFAEVSSNVSVPASSSLLFKANTLAPVYTYEVGFYVGRKFQYVEIFYDNNNHSFSDKVGISSANSVSAAASINASSNSSYLFGSETFNGDFKYIGKGSFTSISQGFQPRYVDISKVTADVSTEVKYEFQFKQKLPLGLVRLALDYGQLRVNNGDYDGSNTVNTNDIVSMTLPLGKNRNPIAVLLSIGDFQLGFPAIINSEESKYPLVGTIYENQPNDTYTTSNIAIDQAGLYRLPAYYQSTVPGTGVDIEFNIIRSGNTIPWTTPTATLQSGDIVRVNNQLTSSRIFDIRDVVLVGPKFYRSALRTGAGPVFNYLNYGILQNPYVRYYTYESDGMDYPAYKTANIRLSSTSGSLVSGLLLETPGVIFLRNGAPAGTYINDANTTSNISLQVILPNYFISNIIIYQVKIDPWDVGNVYIPVGHFGINNFSITSASLVNDSKPLYANMTSIDFSITTLTKQIVSDTFIQSNLILTAMTGNYQPASTISNNQIEARGLVSSNDKATEFELQSNLSSMATMLDVDLTSESVSGVTTINANILSASLTVYIDNILADTAVANLDPYVYSVLTKTMGYNTDFSVTSFQRNIGSNFAISGSEVKGNINIGQVETPITEIVTASSTADLMLFVTQDVNSVSFDDLLPGTAVNSSMSFNYLGDATIFDKKVSTDVLYDGTEFTSNMDYAVSYDPTSFDHEHGVEKFESNAFASSMMAEYISDTEEIPNEFAAEIIEKDYLSYEIGFEFENIKTEFGNTFVADRIGNIDYITKVFSAEFETSINGVEIVFNPELQKSINEIASNFQFQLYVDELWDQGFDPNIGAITANIAVFADNGREGDMGLNKGVPPWRGPFVFYQKFYNLDPNGFVDEATAAAMAVKYVSAGAFQVIGTDFWNFRIFFDTNKVCVPRRGLIFPVSWLIRGG